MASKTGPIIALAAVAGIGFAVYQHGETELAQGKQTGAAGFAADLDKLLGKAATIPGQINTQPPPASASAPAAPAQHTGNDAGIGGHGVYQGNGGLITAAAQAAGVTTHANVANGSADIYGAALWSLQSQQPQSAFYTQDTSVKATFDAVAIGLQPGQ